MSIQADRAADRRTRSSAGQTIELARHALIPKRRADHLREKTCLERHGIDKQMSATAFCRAMFEFDAPMSWDGERRCGISREGEQAAERASHAPCSHTGLKVQLRPYLIEPPELDGGRVQPLRAERRVVSRRSRSVEHIGDVEVAADAEPAGDPDPL